MADEMTPEWCMRMAQLEEGYEIGAGVLHPEAAPNEVERLMAALAKVMPVSVNDGPHYAEAFFGDGSTHSTQAMTMNPQDWLDLQAAYDAIKGKADGG